MSKQSQLPGMEDAFPEDDGKSRSKSAKKTRRKKPTPTPEPNEANTSEESTTEADAESVFASSLPVSEAAKTELPSEPEDLTGKKVFIIDAPSLIFQVFHGLPEMSNKQGEPTNAIFGFMRDVLAMLRDRRPDYLICTFDHKEPTFRDEIYEHYKANREEMPDDLKPQMENIRAFLTTLSIPVVELAGYEADDLIATLAKEAGEQQAEVYLVSSDKDLRQLINDHVKMLNLAKGKSTIARHWPKTGEFALIKWWTFNRWSAIRSITSPEFL